MKGRGVTACGLEPWAGTEGEHCPRHSALLSWPRRGGRTAFHSHGSGMGSPGGHSRLAEVILPAPQCAVQCRALSSEAAMPIAVHWSRSVPCTCSPRGTGIAVLRAVAAPCLVPQSAPPCAMRWSPSVPWGSPARCRPTSRTMHWAGDGEWLTLWAVGSCDGGAWRTGVDPWAVGDQGPPSAHHCIGVDREGGVEFEGTPQCTGQHQSLAPRGTDARR